MRPLGSASVGEHDKLLGCRDQVPACCGSFSKTQLTLYKPHSKCSESKCSTKQQEWKRLALESELTKLKRELYNLSIELPTPHPHAPADVYDLPFILSSAGGPCGACAAGTRRVSVAGLSVCRTSGNAAPRSIPIPELNPHSCRRHRQSDRQTELARGLGTPIHFSISMIQERSAAA